MAGPGGVDRSGGGVKLDHVSVELEEFDGLEKEAINSRGKFVGKSVREFENKASKYLGRTRKNLQEAQDTEQKTLHQRRVEVLKANTGANIGSSLDKTEFKSRGDQISIDAGPVDASIKEITSLTHEKQVGARVKQDGDLVSGEDSPVSKGKRQPTKKVVSRKKFSAQIQKDLTVFFHNAVSSTHTPHGLATLQSKINSAKVEGHISKAQHTKLTREISAQYEQLLSGLKAQLDGLPASKVFSTSYDKQIAKLEAVHELVLGLSLTNPKLLETNRKVLQQHAREAFVASVESLAPDDSSLSVTSTNLKRSRSDMKELLQPVLERTSHNPARKLADIKKETDPIHRLMERQLSITPQLREEMDMLEAEAVKQMKERSLTATNLQRVEVQWRQVKSKYSDLRNNASDIKLFRRLDFNYQRQRRNLRLDEKHLDHQISGLKQDIDVLTKSIKAERLSHAKKSAALRACLNQFSHTLDAAHDPSNILKRDRSTSPVQSQLQELSKLEGITGFDVATAREYFASLSRKGIAKGVLEVLASRHIDLVKSEAFSSQKALLILDQGFNRGKADASGLDAGIDRIRNYKSHALNVEPDRTDNISTSQKLTGEAGRPQSQESSLPETAQTASPSNDEPALYNSELDLLLGDIQEFRDDLINKQEHEKLSTFINEKRQEAPQLEGSLKELLAFFDDSLDQGWSFNSAYVALEAGCSTLIGGSTENQAFEAAIQNLENSSPNPTPQQ
ncbi:MAG: hypothetical protein ACR2PT_12095 [Endozoicomonas sp.]